MKLSRQCEIALDILVTCAGNAEPVTKTRNAASFAVASKSHTAIVVSRLVRAGFLHSARGSKGGVCLARAANGILVGEVVRIFPGASLFPTRRLSNRKMHQVIVEVDKSIFQILDSFTIADLLDRRIVPARDPGQTGKEHDP